MDSEIQIEETFIIIINLRRIELALSLTSSPERGPPFLNELLYTFFLRMAAQDLGELLLKLILCFGVLLDPFDVGIVLGSELCLLLWEHPALYHHLKILVFRIYR